MKTMRATTPTTPTTLPNAPACAECEAPGAAWSLLYGMPLCPSCTRAAAGPPDREPVRLGDLLPPPVRVPVPRIAA
ncbi:hypothetical protein [Streptomyces sp. NPDC047928]|uniref:hypothetical protein n=1 Tax=unclassified Streptomyces TaxID=2593676 RepID=UPI003723818B